MAASTAMHETCGNVSHVSAAHVRASTVSRRPAGRLFGVAMVCSVLGLAAALACGGDTTGPSLRLSPDEAFWRLQLNQHTVQLALTSSQNTIQLTATPLNATGHPLNGIGTVLYRTTDSTVTVDSSGLVTARFTSGFQNAIVVASLTDTTHGITLVDTCFVQVTATAPAVPLGRLTLQLPAGKAPQMPMGQHYTMKTTATDAVGNTTISFPYFMSSDPTIVSIDRLTGVVSGWHTGSVTLYASTWAYGVAKRDSLALDVVAPVVDTIQVLAVFPTGSARPVLTFWPQVVTLGAGGMVMWLNASLTDSMDVVFDDTTNVDSVRLGNKARFNFGTGEGNIGPWVQDTTGTSDIAAKVCINFGLTPPNCGALYNQAFIKERDRLFPVPGTYHYHSARWGASGTIVVQ